MSKGLSGCRCCPLIVVFGTQGRLQPVDRGRQLERYCARCKSIRLMLETQWEKHFSLFFFRIGRVHRSQPVLTCEECFTSYALPSESTDPQEEERPRATECPLCEGGLRLPPTRGTIVIDCPYCGFRIGLERDP